ncbi:fatty acid desaturase [soil metagenome]
MSFVCAFFLSYAFHGLGITVGYHRLLSHRAFKVPRWLEYLIVSGAYLGFEGSPIFWVTAHRLHHRYSDQKGDPHSPRDGLWHAFIGWMYDRKMEITREQRLLTCPDLYRDKVYQALQIEPEGLDGLLCLVVCVIFRIVLYSLFGLPVLIGSLLGTLLAFASPLLVNTLCHMPQLGYSTYSCRDQSRNVWYVAAVAFGEGWHNNHHAFPQSARHGLRPLELDLSWMVISLLRTIGLAKNIRLANGAHAQQEENSDCPVPETTVTVEADAVEAASLSTTER